MKKKLKILLFICISWFLIHSLLIITDGLIDETENCEYAVILGNKVNDDGTLSLRLKARVDKGLELYNSGTISKIIVSGAKGEENHFEGTKMAEYLKEKGVPEEYIIIDNKGNTTRATAVNFKKKFPNAKSVIIVSQYYHVSRTKLAFQKVGVEKTFGIHCNYFEIRDIYSILREFFGYYKYLIIM